MPKKNKLAEELASKRLKDANADYYAKAVAACKSCMPKDMVVSSAVVVVVSLLEEAILALRVMNAHYKDLSSSNPGFMGRMCLEDYALWNDALLRTERIDAKTALIEVK